MDTNMVSSQVSMAMQTAQQGLQSNLNQAAQSLDKQRNNGDIKKIEAAAKEFEAVFVSEMMKPMFEGISTDGPFGGGKGEEVFRGIMLQEYGKMVAESGSIGIADQVKGEMIRMQEAANGNNNLSSPPTQ